MKENNTENDIKALKRLLYRNELTQYGKRRLMYYYEQQEKNYKRVLKENESLKENNMEYERILDLADNRIYRKKYLEERRKEELNLLYPDSDEIYQRYYELKQENEKLKNKLLDTLEGQKVIEEETPQYIKENYIPKQKLKDIIDRIDYDVKKTKEIISKNTNINASYRKNDYQIVRLRAMNTKSLDIKKKLQELLEKEE